MKTLLLVNLGTPDAPTPKALRAYLREFLMDPAVIDLPWIARFLLVHGLIVPFRAARSARAYHEIWTSDGSPLRVYTERLRDKLQNQLGASWRVDFSMRYGERRLKDHLPIVLSAESEEVFLLPLYPQFANATTGSIFDEVRRIQRTVQSSPTIKVIESFFETPPYVRAMAASLQSSGFRETEHLLFSYHGLPERQILKADPSAFYCLKAADCCGKSVDANRQCYKHHCVKTSTLVAESLGLQPARWSIGFQSRLGRAKWIGPATDEQIVRLARQGVRRLSVVCPSFVSDCLETLEEIGIRSRESFLAAGGESFELIPCLNASPPWVEALAEIVMTDNYWKPLSF